MKAGFFTKIDLPRHEEKAFEDFLLGKSEHTKVVDSDSRMHKTRGVSAHDWLKIADDRYFHGYFREGISGYARVLQIDQGQISAWVGQVRILVDVGQYDSAVYWADKGIELLEDARLLAFAKAYAFAYGGKVEAAKAIINVPVEKNESPMLWLLRGEILLRIKMNFIQRLLAPHKNIGRLGAFFCFLKALSLDQRDPFINQRIGFAYLNGGDHRRAFDHLKVSLNEVAENPLTLYGLAKCYAEDRDYEHALYYVKKAIAGNPNLDSAFTLLQWLHSPARNLFGIFGGKKQL